RAPIMAKKTVGAGISPSASLLREVRHPVGVAQARPSEPAFTKRSRWFTFRDASKEIAAVSVPDLDRNRLKAIHGMSSNDFDRSFTTASVRHQRSKDR